MILKINNINGGNKICSQNVGCKFSRVETTRVYPKVSGLNHNEIYAYNNKHSLRSNTKGYGGKTH
jgi:hypothetical protein